MSLYCCNKCVEVRRHNWRANFYLWPWGLYFRLSSPGSHGNDCYLMCNLIYKKLFLNMLLNTSFVSFYCMQNTETNLLCMLGFYQCEIPRKYVWGKYNIRVTLESRRERLYTKLWVNSTAIFNVNWLYSIL